LRLTDIRVHLSETRLDSTGVPLEESEITRLWRLGPSPNIAVARWLTIEIDLVDCV
jgi:hypothetical protein